MNEQRTTHGTSRGLGIVLSIIAMGIVWTAVNASQRLPVSHLPDATIFALPDLRIDLNSASEAELTLLPGIGPRLAERIVHDRDANGPFIALADITRVKWIGPSIIERIEPFAFVNAENPR